MSFPFHKSLRCAARGLLSSLWRERNLRIHTVAAGYVLFFSAFFDLSRAGRAVLLLTIGLVMAAELFNTALERLCDFVSPGYEKRIGLVKDIAAGGVLCCALAAVGVGVCLFWQPERFGEILSWFVTVPVRLVLFVCSLAAAACYIALPCRRDRKKRGD